MANTYGVLTLVRLFGNFYNNLNQLTDPTTVQLYIELPDGNCQEIQSANVVRDNIGQYHYDFQGQWSGSYWYRWQGLGVLVAANVPVQMIFV